MRALLNTHTTHASSPPTTKPKQKKPTKPQSGLEFTDAAGAAHAAVAGWSFVAADGIEMALEEGTSAFITMNPGYIGRAGLCLCCL